MVTPVFDRLTLAGCWRVSPHVSDVYRRSCVRGGWQLFAQFYKVEAFLLWDAKALLSIGKGEGVACAHIPTSFIPSDECVADHDDLHEDVGAGAFLSEGLCGVEYGFADPLRLEVGPDGEHPEVEAVSALFQEAACQQLRGGVWRFGEQKPRVFLRHQRADFVSVRTLAVDQIALRGPAFAPRISAVGRFDERDDGCGVVRGRVTQRECVQRHQRSGAGGERRGLP